MNLNIRHPAVLLLLCIILFMLAHFMLSNGFIFDPDPHEFSSSEHYQMMIHSTEPLTNVTLYLPLPIKNGSPVAGSFYLTEEFFARENISVAFVRSPPGMDPDWTIPVNGSQPLYLKLTADRLYPNETHGTEFLFIHEERTPLDSPLEFQETVYPIGNQSLFLQKVKFSPESTEMIASKDPDLTKYHEVDVVPQHLMIYIDYSSSPSAVVNIASHVIVENSWKESWRTKDNHCSDGYSWFHTGEVHGWQESGGIYSAAGGDYPNLTSPVWQKVMARSISK
ncbi:MAG: hypothetical protein LUQ66_00335 [Methanoregula sp.]|nr:hypothetical protein [Methanoregula sp.]